MPDHRPKILGISGSLSLPSRTTGLVRTILARFEHFAQVELVELASDAAALFATHPKGPRTGRAREVIDAVESADLLVVASPSTAPPIRVP